MLNNNTMKRLVLAAVLPVLALTAAAQPTRPAEICGPPLTLRGYLLYDFHYATGAVGGAAATLDWQVSPMFRLSTGAEYASLNRISGQLEGAATLCGDPRGRHLTLENRYLWRHYPSLELQEFTGALSVGGYLRHVTLHLGLCNRYCADLVQRNDGATGTVFEPMNVMFAIEPMLWDETRPNAHRWNVSLCWSNYSEFIIERVANWFFSLRGYWRQGGHLHLTGEVGIHPVGSLNLTASYDGWYAHLGAAYRF